jgi:hypothetical protein
MVEMNRVGQADFSRVSQKLAGFLQEHGAEGGSMQQRAATIQSLAAGDIMLSADAAARAEQDVDAARSAWTWTWPF